MSPAEIEFPPLLLRGGAAAFGLVTGYLVSGFLVCVMQTLPLHRGFLGFEYDLEEGPAIRKFLPPDRVWLALMHRAGAYAFANNEDDSVLDPESRYDRFLTFDKAGNFAHRYARYRRYDDQGEVRPYLGETRVKPDQ